MRDAAHDDDGAPAPAAPPVPEADAAEHPMIAALKAAKAPPKEPPRRRFGGRWPEEE